MAIRTTETLKENTPMTTTKKKTTAVLEGDFKAKLNFNDNDDLLKHLAFKSNFHFNVYGLCGAGQPAHATNVIQIKCKPHACYASERTKKMKGGRAVKNEMQFICCP